MKKGNYLHNRILSLMGRIDEDFVDSTLSNNNNNMGNDETLGILNQCKQPNDLVSLKKGRWCDFYNYAERYKSNGQFTSREIYDKTVEEIKNNNVKISIPTWYDFIRWGNFDYNEFFKVACQDTDYLNNVKDIYEKTLSIVKEANQKNSEKIPMPSLEQFRVSSMLLYKPFYDKAKKLIEDNGYYPTEIYNNIFSEIIEARNNYNEENKELASIKIPYFKTYIKSIVKICPKDKIPNRPIPITFKDIKTYLDEKSIKNNDTSEITNFRISKDGKEIPLENIPNLKSIPRDGRIVIEKKRYLIYFDNLKCKIHTGEDGVMNNVSMDSYVKSNGVLCPLCRKNVRMENTIRNILKKKYGDKNVAKRQYINRKNQKVTEIDFLINKNVAVEFQGDAWHFVSIRPLIKEYSNKYPEWRTDDGQFNAIVNAINCRLQEDLKKGITHKINADIRKFNAYQYEGFKKIVYLTNINGLNYFRICQKLYELNGMKLYNLKVQYNKNFESNMESKITALINEGVFDVSSNNVNVPNLNTAPINENKILKNMIRINENELQFILTEAVKYVMNEMDNAEDESYDSFGEGSFDTYKYKYDKALEDCETLDDWDKAMAFREKLADTDGQLALTYHPQATPLRFFDDGKLERSKSFDASRYSRGESLEKLEKDREDDLKYRGF